MDRDSNICAGGWNWVMVEEYYIYISKFLYKFFSIIREHDISRPLFYQLNLKTCRTKRKREKEKDIVYESTKFF